MKRNPPKYKTTVWQEYEILEVKTNAGSKEPLTSWHAVLQNGQEIRSNFSIIPSVMREKTDFNYFLMDQEDYEWYNEMANPDYLTSLEMFSSDRKKKLYIRSIPSAVINRNYENNASKKLFTDDVLELIPIALRQQNTPIDNSDKRLENYRNKWKSTDKHLYNSIDIREFKRVLEEFDINKAEITIVHDIVPELGAADVTDHPENSIKTFSPDGKMVMEPAQAAFRIFQLCVCGHNWKMASCEKHSKCVDCVRDIVITAIKEFQTMDQQLLFVTVDYVEEIAEKLTESICIPPKDDLYRTIYNKLLEEDFNSTFPMKYYHTYCDSHNLPIYSSFLTETNDEDLPAWMIRMFLMAGWMQSFFVPNMKKLKTFLLSPLIVRGPEELLLENMNFDTFMENVILNDAVLEKASDESRPETSATYNKMLDSAEKRREMLQQRKNVKKGKGQASTKNSKMEKKTNPAPKETFEKKPNNEQSESSKVENIIMVTTAAKEDKEAQEYGAALKTLMSQFMAKFSSAPSATDVIKEQTENESIPIKNAELLTGESEIHEEEVQVEEEDESKAGQPQNNLKKIHLVDKESQTTPNDSKCCLKCLKTSEICNEAKKELKTTQNKLKTLEKKATKYDALETNMKGKDKEIEKLKLKVQEMEKMKTKLAITAAIEAKLKKANEQIAESRIQFTEQLAQAQLKNDEQNTQMNQLEKDMQEKDRIIAELKETNMRVTVRNEEQAKNIQNLLDRLMKGNFQRTQ